MQRLVSLYAMVAIACSSTSPSNTNDGGGDASVSDASGSDSSSINDAAKGGDAPSGDASIVGSRCTTPTWSGSDVFHSFSPTSGSSTPQASGWGVYDNQWSCTGGTACLTETVHVCDAGSWYVTSNLPANNTAVLTYTSTQVNFPQVALTSFNAITSTFSEQSPHDATTVSSTFGDYEAAYDVFFGTNNNNEIMVWVDNNGQTPGGGWNAQKSNVTIAGTAFDVYFSGSTTYWVAQKNFTQGTVDLLAIFQYTTGTLHNFDATKTTGYLSQIQFGWELCSTNGAAETFYLDAFTVNAN
jgi:hypothetical protein